MTTITPPLLKPLPVKAVQGPQLRLRQPAALAGISEGQVISLTVEERLGQGRYLVNVRGRPVEVESHLALAVKASYEARLERGTGRAILRLEEGRLPEALLKENLSFFLNRQGKFGRCLLSLADLLERLQTARPLPRRMGESLASARELLASLALSAERCEDPSFLKECATKLGLFFEGDLRKVLEGKQREICLAGGLKGQLARLLGEMDGLSEEAPEFAALLRQIGKEAEEVIRGVENLQVMNALLRQTDRTSLIQIPFAFPGGPRQGEIFIGEEGRGQEGSGRTFRANLFLEMDILGPLVIELSLVAGKLTCLCRCESELASHSLGEELPNLALDLRQAGYDLERLTCLRQEGLERQRVDFMAGLELCRKGGLDLFA